MPWVLVLGTPNYKPKANENLLPVSNNVSPMCCTFLKTDSQEAPRCCGKDYDNIPTCFKIEEECHYQNVILARMLAAEMSLSCLCYQEKKTHNIFCISCLSNLFAPTVSSYHSLGCVLGL